MAGDRGPSTWERDQLARYWDAITTGHPAAPTFLDPALVAALQEFSQRAARDQARRPDPIFVQHLLEDLMATAHTLSPGFFTPGAAPSISPNGHHAGSWQTLDRPLPSQRFRGTVGAVLTVILVILVVVGSFSVFGPGRPTRHEDTVAFVPGISGTPEASPAAIPVVKQIWETTGGPDTPLDAPFGMAVDPNGNLWVADTNNARFQIFAPDGTFRETWGTAGAGEGQFNFQTFDQAGSGAPGGYGDIVFDDQGNFYVADPGNFRIQKFAGDRSFLLAWGIKGTGHGQFLDIVSVAIGPDGNIYVADENRNDVQRFDADGHFLNTIGGPGNGPGQMLDTEAAAIDTDGTVWVTDYDAGHIQRFSSDGHFLGSWGQRGYEDGQLQQPVNVAFDPSGRVWVVDIAEGKVQVFAPDGHFLTTIHRLPTVSHSKEFRGPIGIALGSTGRVYVSDWTDNFVTAFQVQLPGTAPTPSSLATPPAYPAVVASPTAAVAGSEASPSSTPQAILAPGVTEDAVVFHQVFDDIPANANWVGVERISLGSGAVMHQGTPDTSGVGPMLYRVEGGTVTGTADGTMTIMPAGQPRATAVAGGVDVVLSAGDVAFVPPGVASVWRNDGPVPATLMATGVTHLGGGWRDDTGADAPHWAEGPVLFFETAISVWPITPPAAPAAFTVQRMTLAPGARLPQAPVQGLSLVGVDDGTLTIGLVKRSDRTGATGSTQIHAGSWMDLNSANFVASELRNDDSKPLVLVVLTVAPIAASTPTP
jgi:sugar lactone lactonase YvrE